MSVQASCGAYRSSLVWISMRFTCRRRCTSSWSTVMRALWRRCPDWGCRNMSSGSTVNRSLQPSTSSTNTASSTGISRVGATRSLSHCRVFILIRSTENYLHASYSLPVFVFISGANIFLTSSGLIKLGDFGCSVKLRNNTHTMPGEVNSTLGTAGKKWSPVPPPGVTVVWHLNVFPSQIGLYPHAVTYYSNVLY